MIIKILEFYPIRQVPEKLILEGTFKISILDKGIDMLGIHLKKVKNKLFFSLPGRFSKHHVSGEKIWYPFLSFNDKDERKQFIKELHLKGLEFIESRLSDGLYTSTINKPIEAKETPKADKVIREDKVEVILNKEWSSPPVLKARKHSNFKKI